MTVIDRRYSVASGTAIKAPCIAATTANITLGGLQTIDGVSLAEHDRVLVKNQSTASENGIYEASSGNWLRSKDFDGRYDVVTGTQVYIVSGTSNGGKQFVLTTSGEITIGTSNISFSGFFGSDDSSVSVYLPDYEGAVSRSVQSRLQDRISVKDFGAVGDGVADDTDAIQAAADEAYTRFLSGLGGAVYIPSGMYRITTAIDVPKLISFYGDPGYGSQIHPDGCGAFVFNFTVGYGDTSIRDLYIQGTNCETQIALYQPGTLDEAVTITGLNFERVKIRDFNLCLSLRSVQTVRVTNCYWERIGAGASIRGNCFAVIFNNTTIIKDAGCGVSAGYGILIDEFNFTSGSGQLSPESVHVDHCRIINFDIGVEIEVGLFVTLTNPDIQARVEGVRVNIITSNLNIWGGYILTIGNDASVGVIFYHHSEEVENKSTIYGTKFHSSGGADDTTIGVLIARSGDGFADNVTVENCSFLGHTAYDIAVYGSVGVRLLNNRCRSSGLDASILVNSIPTSSGDCVFIDGNRTEYAISVDTADMNNGRVRFGVNTIAGVLTYAPIRTGSATPQGSVVSTHAGQRFHDLLNGKVYEALSAGASDGWVALN